MGFQLLARDTEDGKHVCVNNQEERRFVVNVVVDERTLREIYLRGFEMVVKEAQPWMIMCAYNSVNGIPCSEHKWLFQDVIRREWKFCGAVVTDWGAINDRVKGLEAGVDLEMPGSYGAHNHQIKEALRNETFASERLDEAVKRNIELFIKAKRSQVSTADFDMLQHHELAYRVALECAVLLKNDNNVLPLAKDASIAIIGAFAKTPRIQGMGSSRVNPFKVESLWDSVSRHTLNVIFSEGYDPDDSGMAVCETSIREAIDASTRATFAIVMIGLPDSCESEAFDRAHLNLPAHHNALVEAVCASNPNTIVVLSNGGPVTMPWVSKPKAILESFLLGQASGRAIVDLLFGVTSPSGKLATTFPLELSHVPADKNFPGKNNQVEYKEGLNVGYRYFCTSNAPVLYPFGHGLSYSKFEYSDLTAEVNVDGPKAKSVTLTFKLTNIGAVAAAEICQCYVHFCNTNVYKPEIELAEFSKIFLSPDESTLVKMSLNQNSFSFYDIGTSDWVVEPGKFEVRIGASCCDIRLKTIIVFRTGQAASGKSLKTYPANKISHPINLDDSLFSKMFGDLDVKVSENTDIVTRNTLLVDVARMSWIGYWISALVFRLMVWQLPDRKDENIRSVAIAMRNNLPLRGLVLFSQGGLSFGMLDMVIAIMNGQYTHAARMCMPSFMFRKSYR